MQLDENAISLCFAAIFSKKYLNTSKYVPIVPYSGGLALEIMIMMLNIIMSAVDLISLDHYSKKYNAREFSN